MCQAISDGGRRCPVHRRDAIVAIKLASQITGLPAGIVESLFNELRREGRHIQVSGLVNDDYGRVIQSMRDRQELLTPQYVEILNDHMSDDAPSGDTLYALRRLHGAAMSRKDALTLELSRIATEIGTTPARAQERFFALRAEVGRDAPEFTSAAERAAFDANLPSDRASVVALARLRAERIQGEPRITREPWDERSSHILEAGYDPEGGRLEIVFRGSEDNVYAWHSVPQDVWDAFCEGRSMSVFSRMIRGNPDFMYANQEEAARDAYTVRCDSCGQFRAASHTCPARPSDTIVSPAPATDGAESNPTVDQSTQPGETGEPESVEYATTLNAEQAARFTATEAFIEELANMSEEERAYARISDEDIADVRARQAELMEFIARAESGDPEVAAFTEPVPDPDADLESPVLNLREASPVLATVAMRRGRKIFYEEASGITATYGAPDGLEREPALVSPRFTAEEQAEADEQRIYTRFIASLRGYHIDSGLNQSNAFSFQFDNIDATIRRTGYMGPGLKARGERLPFHHAYAAAEEAYSQTPEAQIPVHQLEQVSRRTKDYAPVLHAPDSEGNMRVLPLPITQKTRWCSVRDLRNAFASGAQAVSASIEWTYEPESRWRGPTHLMDAHGYALPQKAGRVTGRLKVGRLTADGPLTTLSGIHEFHCTCYKYRATYRCEHIDYVRNNAPRMANKMLGVASSSIPTTTQGFPASITRRTDVRVQQEQGSTVVSFVRPSPNRWRETTLSSTATESDIGADGTPTIEQSAHAMFLAHASPFRLPPARAIEAASRNHTAHVPIRLDSVDALAQNTLQESSRRIQISGEVSVSRGDNNEVVVSANHERLRCSCGRFTAEAGPCSHVQAVVEHVRREVVAARPRRDRQNSPDADLDLEPVPLRAIDESIAVNEEALEIIRVENYLRTQPESEDLSDEEISQVARETVANRRALEAEARAQQEERERQYMEERARQERELIASYNTSAEAQRHQVEAAVERFLASDPDFARSRESFLRTRLEAWNEVEPGYGEDLARARADIEEAIAAKRSTTRQHLEPKTENVTDGACDPRVPGSRRFGVEIEFVLPRNVNRETALNNILKDLREAGLTSQTRMNHYHQGARSGWNEWSLERDCTVTGELVTPILSDSPEDWEKMRKALEILKRHGAKTSTRAGSHVHVSTGTYAGVVSKHTELVRIAKENEDILYRAAADPSRGTHRGDSYCRPNVDTPRVDVHKSDPAGLIRGIDDYSHASHTAMINLSASTRASTTAHAEFRMWDASLDLATIQQQVATSVAMVEAAERTIENEEFSRPRSENAVLGSLGEARSQEVSDEALAKVVAFVDKTFRRQEDRKRFLAMFAVGKWAGR